MVSSENFGELTIKQEKRVKDLLKRIERRDSQHKDVPKVATNLPVIYPPISPAKPKKEYLEETRKVKRRRREPETAEEADRTHRRFMKKLVTRDRRERRDMARRSGHRQVLAKRVKLVLTKKV